MKIIPFNDLSRIHLPLADAFCQDVTDFCTSNDWILGSAVDKFEASLAESENVRYAIAVNSGTSAIELLLRAHGIGHGDEVLVPAMTFVATAFSIIQVGALPVLVDIDPKTGLVDPASISKCVSKETKALIVVTLHGRVDALAEYKSICEEFGIKLLIDGAQSHLGGYDGRPQADFASGVTLSFYPGKNLGALGEGGAVLTNDETLAEKIRISRNWGAAERYKHDEFGGNFRLDTLQCAFLIRKLPLLPNWTKERQRIAGLYRKHIVPSLLFESLSPKGNHVFHIFSIRTANRDQVMKILKGSGISTAIHYPRAIHQNKYYKGKVDVRCMLYGAEEFAKLNLSLPIFPEMQLDEIDYVISNINDLTETIK